MSVAKTISNAEDMPKDFWNYKVNPILGYYIRPLKVSEFGTREKKYE